MRQDALSRREFLRLGALALPGAGLAFAPLARALKAPDTGPAFSVVSGVPIRSVRNNQRQISLTFDDMWSEYNALNIGRACARRGIRATFFPTGMAVQRNLERPNPGFENLYPRLRDMGHEFGSHLFTHEVLRDLTLEELVWREMDPSLEVLRRALGSDFTPVAIRPPYGIMSDAIRELSRQYDIPVVLWNLDSGDTLCAADRIKSPLVCCSEMLVTMRKHLVPGSVVLLHTIRATSLAIDPIADLLEQRYMRAVALSTLLNLSA